MPKPNRTRHLHNAHPFTPQEVSAYTDGVMLHVCSKELGACKKSDRTGLLLGYTGRVPLELAAVVHTSSAALVLYLLLLLLLALRLLRATRDDFGLGLGFLCPFFQLSESCCSSNIPADLRNLES